MNKESILIIEDDEDILELVNYNVTKNGFKSLCAISGEDGIELLNKNIPDIILLDIMLPGIDGFEVCKTIRNSLQIKHIPIIMLTAKGEDTDIVTGLEAGADDYITKPFSPSVLIARIKSVLRRRSKEALDKNAVIRIKDLHIHPVKHEVLIKDQLIELTSTEFEVLHLLARKPGWALTRYQIVGIIKGDDYAVTDRSVDVIIVGLRKKLGEYGEYIETVRGVGYRFKE